MNTNKPIEISPYFQRKCREAVDRIIAFFAEKPAIVHTITITAAEYPGMPLLELKAHVYTGEFKMFYWGHAAGYARSYYESVKCPTTPPPA